LLRSFFGSKYAFDKENFILKRGDQEMSRGVHRTLSDGEKTTIAFCYFVACIHKKVSSNQDYRKVFLVIDDPVNSMSFDFVFSISQAIKFLRVSDKGDISISPDGVKSENAVRPELFILTHSSYFFNILHTNAVIDEAACFSLHAVGWEHKIVPLRKYVAPFQEQLKDIYRVSIGHEPDHTTANAVRSVLEAVGRFCRPDECKNLGDFVAYVAREDEIEVKSVLINSLCHGSYYEEVPQPEDLRMACTEVVEIVSRYASGQIEVVKKLLEAR
jgi:wobble nucleotide-excising tRNase